MDVLTLATQIPCHANKVIEFGEGELGQSGKYKGKNEIGIDLSDTDTGLNINNRDMRFLCIIVIYSSFKCTLRTQVSSSFSLKCDPAGSKIQLLTKI